MASQGTDQNVFMNLLLFCARTMICKPESKYGSEKSTAFSRLEVMVIAAIATSASPRCKVGSN